MIPFYDLSLKNLIILSKKCKSSFNFYKVMIKQTVDCLGEKYKITSITENSIRFEIEKEKYFYIFDCHIDKIGFIFKSNPTEKIIFLNENKEPEDKKFFFIWSFLKENQLFCLNNIDDILKKY
jgi:hypothetical protein